jgi:hypothetical protein
MDRAHLSLSHPWCVHWGVHRSYPFSKPHHSINEHGSELWRGRLGILRLVDTKGSARSLFSLGLREYAISPVRRWYAAPKETSTISDVRTHNLIDSAAAGGLTGAIMSGSFRAWQISKCSNYRWDRYDTAGGFDVGHGNSVLAVCSQ